MSTADLVIVNAVVHTVDRDNPRASALAIADGRILAVGSDEEISALAGPATEVRDLAGAAVVPGLIDVHNHHLLAGEADLFQLSFPPTASFDEVVEAVRGYAESLGPDEWVIGEAFGCAQGDRRGAHGGNAADRRSWSGRFSRGPRASSRGRALAPPRARGGFADLCGMDRCRPRPPSAPARLVGRAGGTDGDGRGLPPAGGRHDPRLSSPRTVRAVARNPPHAEAAVSFIPSACPHSRARSSSPSRSGPS